MVAIALNLAGVYEFGLRMMGVGQSLTADSVPTASGRKSFFTGLLAVVVATPVHGPLHGRRNRLRVGAADRRRPGRIPRAWAWGSRFPISCCRSRPGSVGYCRSPDRGWPSSGACWRSPCSWRRCGCSGSSAVNSGRLRWGSPSSRHCCSPSPCGRTARRPAPEWRSGMVCNGRRRTRRVHCTASVSRRGLPRIGPQLAGETSPPVCSASSNSSTSRRIACSATSIRASPYSSTSPPTGA